MKADVHSYLGSGTASAASEPTIASRAPSRRPVAERGATVAAGIARGRWERERPDTETGMASRPVLHEALG